MDKHKGLGKKKITNAAPYLFLMFLCQIICPPSLTFTDINT